jgi:antitoxin MazE
MRVVKWGDGLAVHLPAEIVEALGLKEGDDIDIRIASHRRSNVDHENDRERALQALRRFEKYVPAGWKFDRDEANER